jgi:hypothetical protein
MKKQNRALNFVIYLLLYPFALLLVFEEWGWIFLSEQFEKLAILPPWKHLEKMIVNLPPWAAVIVLGIPLLTILPIKLLGLLLLNQGHFLAGLTVIITAKILGTALFARIFQLTLPSLLKIAWFARSYPHWKLWKDTLLSKIRNSIAWRAGRNIKLKLQKLMFPKKS